MRLTTTTTAKGQVTIPAEIRRLLGIGPNARVTFTLEDHKVMLTAEPLSVAQKTAGIAKSSMPPPSIQEEQRRIEQVIAEEALARGWSREMLESEAMSVVKRTAGMMKSTIPALSIQEEKRMAEEAIAEESVARGGG